MIATVRCVSAQYGIPAIRLGDSPPARAYLELAETDALKLSRFVHSIVGGRVFRFLNAGQFWNPSAESRIMTPIRNRQFIGHNRPIYNDSFVQQKAIPGCQKQLQAPFMPPGWSRIPRLMNTRASFIFLFSIHLELSKLRVKPELTICEVIDDSLWRLYIYIGDKDSAINRQIMRKHLRRTL